MSEPTPWLPAPKLDHPRTATRLKALWQDFIEGRPIEGDHLRSPIINSWQRCQSHQLEPVAPKVSQLGPQELERLLKSREEYTQVIEPSLAKVDGLAKLSNYVLAFVNHDGYVLMMVGSEHMRTMVEKINFQVGANWSEEFAGTTAAGVVLATGQPSQVFHAEHYLRELHQFSCTAVPVFDPFSKQLLGVLDFVALMDDFQPHTMGLAMQMARCLELEIYRHHKEQEDFFRECSTQLTLDHLERGVVVLDNHDRIRRVNLTALNYLNLGSDNLLNTHLADVAVMAGWRDRSQDHLLELPSGLRLRLKSKSLIHQKRRIGSLILLEPAGLAPAQAGPPETADQAAAPIGQAPIFKSLVVKARNAALFESNVLILGDTGTGKEVLARFIHACGPRRDKPLVAINCGSIPRELLGSELFGYEGGAFTGAKQKGHPSKFELANGGTLLLDEISEMPLDSQVYLLRVIEERAVQRLGASRTVPVNVRLIAASNKDLAKEVEAGRFRQDLFFRLNVVRLDLPTLRQRWEDIPLLARHFLAELSARLGKRVASFSAEALDAMATFSWPGNVRELRNVVEQAIISCPGSEVALEHLPPSISLEPPLATGMPVLDQERYRMLLIAHRKTQGNVAGMARLLKVSRPTIYAWRKKYGLDAVN